MFQFNLLRSQSGNSREMTTSPPGHHWEATVAPTTTAKRQQFRANSREMTSQRLNNRCRRSMRFCVALWLLSFQVHLGHLWYRGQKIEHKLFFLRLFGHRRDIPAKSRDIPPQKVWFPWFRGTYRTFWPQPFRVEDPHPTGKYRDSKVWVCAPFSCLKLISCGPNLETHPSRLNFPHERDDGLQGWDLRESWGGTSHLSGMSKRCKVKSWSKIWGF